MRDLQRASLQTLRTMERSNDNYEKLQERFEEAKYNLEGSRSVVAKLKSIIEVLKQKRSDYSSGMKTTITEAIKHAVNSSLIHKSYDVELVPSVYRGKNILKPYFIDENGVYLPPKIVEGDMLNQVFSFASVVILSVKSGYNTIYYDEAFASANARSLLLIRKLIRDYNDMGIKIIIVTQNPLLLYGLERHVVELVSDGVCVSEVLEYDISDEEYDEDIAEKIVELFDTMSKGGNVDGFFSTAQTDQPRDDESRREEG